MKRSSSNSESPAAGSCRGIPEVPDYELLRWIGGGAYGEVWLGRAVTGAYRAVKVVWREDFELDRTFEQEFEGIRHFEPVSRRHEGVVDIYHVGRNGEKGFYYYVMELADDAVRGSEIIPEKYIPKTLSQVMRDDDELGWEACRDSGVTLSRALNHLHQNGLSHRDVKPSNIIFVDGEPKLADIGLVACSGEMAYVGTDGYIPPEGAGTPAADIFSLGKVLYEMSTGFDRMEFPAVPATRLESADASKWREINEVVCTACSPMGQKRFPSAAAMAATLDAVGEVIAPPSLLPPAAAVIGFGTLSIVAALAWSGFGGGELSVPAPAAPAPIVAEVKVPDFSDAPGERLPVLSTEDLANQPVLKHVWKNSLGLEFDPEEQQHISRFAIEAQVFNVYVGETQRALEGEVINIRDTTEGEDGATAVRHIMAVPPQDALAFCRWMENKDRSAGFLSVDHFYDIRRFDDFSQTLDSTVTGPKDPGNIAFRCVVAKRDYGALVIESDPPGADIFFRGKRVGATPFEDRAVPIGRARYELRKEGYRVSEVSGVVRPEGILELTATLDKEGASVAMGERWKNSLGMDFVPVGDILVSAFETRVSDYDAFVEETGRNRHQGDFEQGADHPAVWLNRVDAEAFCRWLTKKERKVGLIGESFEYRLPTDVEWSAAAGLPLEKGESPASRNQKIGGVFPWGYQWPPPPGSGNLADGSSGVEDAISGYLDLFANTAPVGSFRPNELGLYDLSGNVWEWVSGDFGGEVAKYENFAVVRGGSWVNGEREKLLSSCRNAVPSELREPLYGFRPVIAEK